MSNSLTGRITIVDGKMSQKDAMWNESNLSIKLDKETTHTGMKNSHTGEYCRIARILAAYPIKGNPIEYDKSPTKIYVIINKGESPVVKGTMMSLWKDTKTNKFYAWKSDKNEVTTSSETNLEIKTDLENNGENRERSPSVQSNTSTFSDMSIVSTSSRPQSRPPSIGAWSNSSRGSSIPAFKPGNTLPSFTSNYPKSIKTFIDHLPQTDRDWFNYLNDPEEKFKTAIKKLSEQPNAGQRVLLKQCFNRNLVQFNLWIDHFIKNIPEETEMFVKIFFNEKKEQITKILNDNGYGHTQLFGFAIPEPEPEMNSEVQEEISSLFEDSDVDGEYVISIFNYLLKRSYVFTSDFS